MYVGSQPGVVGEIPTIMVRVLINYNVVTVPVPVVAIRGIIVGNAEKEAAKPEPPGPATFKPEDMTWAKARGEMSMRPRMVPMEVFSMTARIVPYPTSVGVNVRRR